MSLQAVSVGMVDRQTREMTPERFCAEYSAQVCRFAAMVTHSASDAEDLAQESLLKAVRKLHQYDPKRGAIEPWLWRIVVNVARDSHRLEGRRTALWDRLTRTWHEPSQSVEARAIENVTNADLVAAIRSLPARERTLIALRFSADLDLESVGAAVGLSAGAAGKALARALARLRQQLEVDNDHDA